MWGKVDKKFEKLTCRKKRDIMAQENVAVGRGLTGEIGKRR